MLGIQIFMTDKSCDDINASLARSKGWRYDIDPLGPKSSGRKAWQKELAGRHLCRKHPPDFCGDWKFAGPELVEMLNAGFMVEIRIIPDGIGQSVYSCGVYKKSKFGGTDGLFRTCISEGEGRKVEEAIARAAEAMIEEGK